MTPAQKRFADEYLIDLNATRAYKVAYPNCKKDETASAAGSRMLGNVKVKQYIESKQKELEEKSGVTQQRIIEELAGIAFSNGTDFAQIVEKEYKQDIFDKEGNYKGTETRKYKTLELTETNKLTDAQKSAIAGIKETANGLEIKTNDKVKALELLGKHLGMFREKIEISKSSEDTIKEIDEYIKRKVDANE